jgi:hypothetical protein
MPCFGGAFFMVTGIRCHHRHRLVEWQQRPVTAQHSRLCREQDRPRRPARYPPFHQLDTFPTD